MLKQGDYKFPVGSLVCFDPTKISEGQCVSLDEPLTIASRAAMLRCVFRVTRSEYRQYYSHVGDAFGVGCILIEDPLGYYNNHFGHSQVGYHFTPKMDLLTQHPRVVCKCSRRLTVRVAKAIR